MGDRGTVRQWAVRCIAAARKDVLVMFSRVFCNVKMCVNRQGYVSIL